MSKYDEKLLDAAVNWWAEKVTGLHHHDNGDRSGHSAPAMMMADLGRVAVSEEQAEVFKSSLKKMITEEFEKLNEWQKKNFGVQLGCDYGPGYLLRQAAEKAEIPPLNFPFKTWMNVTETAVTVSDGYAAPQKIIYPPKEANSNG